MGPHSFKCGKWRCSMAFLVSSGELQWGRTLSSAESRPHPSNKRRDGCFNGAALFQVRKAKEDALLYACKLSFNGAALFQVRKEHANGNGLHCLVKLQWGRTLSSAESHTEERGGALRSAASMGPHSFKCGKEVIAERVADWLACFNGAALFQVRKGSLEGEH